MPNTNDLTRRYALASEPDAKAQCTDAAGVLIVLFRSIGIACETVIINKPGDGNGFDTKSIDPIGALSWTEIQWDYHHLVDLEPLLDPAQPLYDACLVLDNDGQIGAPYNSLYPIEMSWQDYRSKLWYSGDFYRYDWSSLGIEKPYYHDLYRQGSEPF